jgi:hypothetical protein
LGRAAGAGRQLPQAGGGIGPCPIAACRRHVSTNAIKFLGRSVNFDPSPGSPRRCINSLCGQQGRGG